MHRHCAEKVGAQAQRRVSLTGVVRFSVHRRGANFCVQVLCSFLCTGVVQFLAKPRSWGAAPRFAGFPPKFTSVCAGPPSPPPASKTDQPGSPAVSGDGEGQGVVLLGVPRNEFCKS